MAKHNEFPGYIKLPDSQKAKNLNVRLDFNGQIEAEPGRAELKGFYLRMFIMRDDITAREIHPEMSVYLRPEEWLDLIAAMREEYEAGDKGRKDLERASGSEETNED